MAPPVCVCMSRGLWACRRVWAELAVDALGRRLGLDTAVGGRRSRGLGLREVRCLVSGSRMTVRAGEVADHLETGSLTPPGSGPRWVRRRRLSQFSRAPGTARHTDQCRTPRRGPRDGLRSGPGLARYRPLDFTPIGLSVPHPAEAAASTQFSCADSMMGSPASAFRFCQRST